MRKLKQLAALGCVYVATATVCMAQAIDADIQNTIDSGTATVTPLKALVITIATFLLGYRIFRKFTGR